MAEARATEQQAIRKQYADFYRISGGLTLVVILVWICSQFFTDGFWTNLVTEGLGVLTTILVLDQINQWRDRNALKNRLLMEVRSPAHDTAVTAMEWLRREDWLDPDTFKGKTLERVNWNGAYIGDLNFEGTQITNCRLMSISNQPELFSPYQAMNFKKAFIYNTNLDNSRFGRVDFSGASINTSTLIELQCLNATMKDTRIVSSSLEKSQFIQMQIKDTFLDQTNLNALYLRSSNIEYCIIQNATFNGANFIQVTLKNTSFSNCDLTTITIQATDFKNIEFTNTTLLGAELRNCTFEACTWTNDCILPDGANWTPETDMAKFTDPNHPEFAATREAINAIRAEMGVALLD